MTFKYHSIIFKVIKDDFSIGSMYFKKIIQGGDDGDENSSDNQFPSIMVVTLKEKVFQSGDIYRITRYSDKVMKNEFSKQISYGNTLYSIYKIKLDGGKESFKGNIKRAAALEGNRCLIDLLYERFSKEGTCRDNSGTESILLLK